MRAINGQWHGAKHDGRQDKMADGIKKRALLTGEKRIDQHEAGDRRKIILDEIDASGNRREMQRIRHYRMRIRPHQKIGIE